MVTDDDLLLARNPIVIRSRLRLANEYTDLDGGGSRVSCEVPLDDSATRCMAKAGMNRFF